MLCSYDVVFICGRFSGLMSITIYGGLILFSLFLLFDTQLVVKRASTYPIAGTAEEYKYGSGYYGGGLGQGYFERPAAALRRYDPINSWVFYPFHLTLPARNLAELLFSFNNSSKVTTWSSSLQVSGSCPSMPMCSTFLFEWRWY